MEVFLNKLVYVKVSISIQVSIMAMRKVNCELVCHFKDKLLSRVFFSLKFQEISNLNAI